MLSNSPIISAEVVLKSRDETSKYTAESSHLSAQGDYLPDFEVVIECARYFRDIGFHVTPSHQSVRIEGLVGLFERVFGIHLTLLVNDAFGDTFVEASGSLRIPRPLEDMVVNVIFNFGARSQRSLVRRFLQAESQV